MGGLRLQNKIYIKIVKTKFKTILTTSELNTEKILHFDVIKNIMKHDPPTKVLKP